MFSNQYLHNIPIVVRNGGSEGTHIRAKCFASMKKNEAPKVLKAYCFVWDSVLFTFHVLIVIALLLFYVFVVCFHCYMNL